MEQHTLAESRGNEVTCTPGGAAAMAGMGGTLGGGAWPRMLGTHYKITLGGGTGALWLLVGVWHPVGQGV